MGKLQMTRVELADAMTQARKERPQLTAAELALMLREPVRRVESIDRERARQARDVRVGPNRLAVVFDQARMRGMEDLTAGAISAELGVVEERVVLALERAAGMGLVVRRGETWAMTERGRRMNWLRGTAGVRS